MRPIVGRLYSNTLLLHDLHLGALWYPRRMHLGLNTAQQSPSSTSFAPFYFDPSDLCSITKYSQYARHTLKQRFTYKADFIKRKKSLCTYIRWIFTFYVCKVYANHTEI